MTESREKGLRVYEPDELGADGYPRAWNVWNCDVNPSRQPIKNVVRELAGHRCVRCQHPYRPGSGEWSPCDPRCEHGGPVRFIDAPGALGLVKQEIEHPAGYYCNAGDGLDAQWRILTVHHLDGDKANCRWWNLMSACQRCHLQIQGRVVMEQVYPYEHSTWFKPYAAGYYAATYLGEDLTREETEARLDELLDLERCSPHGKGRG